ncbi:MAG: hypothetical protein ABL921_25080 [Pirellula sp.]
MIHLASPKSRFQFTLVTIFVLLLAVAGTLSGYRVGFQRGYLGGERKRQLEIPFAKVFLVDDLVGPHDDDSSSVSSKNYESLIGIIEQTIALESWAAAGGTGTILAMPSNQTLMINQTLDVHEKIESLLSQIRAAKVSSDSN